jgi:hypothetical protein
VRALTVDPSICSGAVYSTVPTHWPVFVNPLIELACFVRPKSDR